MAKIKKKGTSGQAKNFITRTQAVRKLQISLPDFRRLCIFKGIYPREPRNKRKASKSSTQSTTFYYTKDIQYLLHEPLLNKFRDHKALSKKIARSLGKGEVGDAARLEKTGSKKISLDHIIKERYPTFVDALRDLDDALSLLFLFANLPATSAVPSKTISLCQRLCLEFQHYLITSHSLRKSFLSIKGIYYQATIQGQDILWLVPYKFVQRVTNDVDFRIMGTFVEFYTTLLGFVNFRLYTSIGLVYPPKFNAKSDEQGGELGAFTLEGRVVQSAKLIEEAPRQPDGDSNRVVDGVSEMIRGIQEKVVALGELSDPVSELNLGAQESTVEEVDETIDTFKATADGADILPQPQSSGIEASSLFASLTVFLSRETPRQPLEFILRAFGCKRIGWDVILGDGAFTNNESNPIITHQIFDRPPISPSRLPEPPTTEIVTQTTPLSQNLPPGSRVPGRTYVQPQWVWDCINEGRLLRPDLYAPGATLPPHLSPWIKPTQGTYDPSKSLAEQEREGEAEEAAEGFAEEDAANIESEEEEEVDAMIDAAPEATSLSRSANDDGESSIDDHGMTIANDSHSESDSDSDSQVSPAPNPAPSAEDDFDGFSDTSLSPTENQASLYQAELEAEARGVPFSEVTALKKPLRGILKNNGGNDARAKAARNKREEEEELERRKGMMSRRKRKLVEKMMYGQKKGEEVAEGLRAKRRKAERNGGVLTR